MMQMREDESSKFVLAIGKTSLQCCTRSEPSLLTEVMHAKQECTKSIACSADQDFICMCNMEWCTASSQWMAGRCKQSHKTCVLSWNAWGQAVAQSVRHNFGIWCCQLYMQNCTLTQADGSPACPDCNIAKSWCWRVASWSYLEKVREKGTTPQVS